MWMRCMSYGAINTVYKPKKKCGLRFVPELEFLSSKIFIKVKKEEFYDDKRSYF